MNSKFLFIKILLMFLCLVSFSSFCKENSLKEILKNDLIGKEKNKIKKNSKVHKTSSKTKKEQLIDKEELDTIVKKLWLIRNNTVLKWNKKLPDYGLNEAIEKTFKDFGKSGISYKVLFMHSSVISHQMIKMKDKEFLFILSKHLAERLDLTKQEISMLLLEAFIRGEVDHYAPNEEVLKLGKGLDYKKSINDYIEKSIHEIDEYVFNYKGTFSREEKVIKIIFNNLSNQKKYLKTYKRLLSKLDSLVKEDSRYKYISARYPAPEVKINWLEGMNVK